MVTSAEQEVLESGEDKEEHQVVEFLLGDEAYAVDVSRVSSIVKKSQIARLPRAPESVDGIMDLRGETTAVIDPKILLGLPTEESVDKQILVLDRPSDKQNVGLLVDDVIDVADYTEDQIDAAEEVSDLQTKGVEEHMVEGIIRKPEKDDIELVVWIDVDKVLEMGGTGEGVGGG